MGEKKTTKIRLKTENVFIVCIFVVSTRNGFLGLGLLHPVCSGV